MKESLENISQDYLQNVRRLFLYYKELGDKALAQVNESEIYWRPDEESNNIAIIIKHLSGNMLSRWTDFLTTDGEKEWRNRDDEFVDDIDNKQSLRSIWAKGWNCLFSAVGQLTQDDLQKVVYIRNEGHTVVEAINRQLTHCAQHVGQIVYIAKSIRSKSWQSLSIPRGESDKFNKGNFSKAKRQKHLT